MSPSTLLFAALLLYAAGTALSLVRLFADQRAPLERWFLAVMTAGFVLHTGAIAARIHETGSIPFANRFESLLSLGWILVLGFFVTLLLTRVAVLSFFISPLVLILAVWAYALRGDAPAPLHPGAGAPALYWFHIVFSLLGVAGFVLGVAFGWMYEIQEKALKKKTSSRLAGLVPSLATCDRWGNRAITLGFVLFTFGILHAGLFSYRSRGAYIGLNPKEIGAVVVWLVFAAVLQARLAWGPHGRLQSWLGTAGLVAVAVTLLGIR